MAQPPSYQDVQAMSELTNLLSDVEAGRPLTAMTHNNSTTIPTELLEMCSTNTAGDVNAMGEIMAGLDNVSQLYDGAIAHKYSHEYTPSSSMQTESEPDLYSLLAQDVQMSKKQPVTIVSGNEYKVVAEEYNGAKISTYTIRNTHTGSVIADELILKESATALCSMLNNGVPLTNNKFIGVLSMGLQYTQIFDNTFQQITARQSVLKECNYDAARDMDAAIKHGKDEANAVKSELLRFLTKANINYK